MPVVVRPDEEVSLYYELYGSGAEKVLFIMGLMTSLREWAPQIEYFRNSTSYQICVFDNRGIGRSSVPSGRYSTRSMAEDALAIVNTLEWETFHLVGESMGGMISQELTLLAPQRVLTLALASTHAGAVLPPLKRLHKAALVPFFEQRHDPTPKLDLLYSPTFLKQRVSNGQTMRELLHAEYVRRIHLDGPVTFAGGLGQLSAVATHFVSKARLQLLKESGIPILILTGTDDFLVNPENSIYLNNFLAPRQFIILKGAGHQINVECSEKYNTALCNHFTRQKT